MAKNKKDKSIEKFLKNEEYEWAKKRGKDFPLAIGDRVQWHLEILMQKHFQEIKDIFIKGSELNATSKSVSNKSVNPKLLPFWTNDNACDTKQYRLMAEANMDKTVTAIEDVVNCGVSCYIDGFTILSLSRKSQICKESGREFCFSRAAVMVSPSPGNSKYLCIGADQKINATIYSGYGINDDDDDPWTQDRIGFLVFSDKNNKNHAVTLEEFISLVELEEDKEYLFTFFSWAENIMCTLILLSLDNIEFSAERGEIKVITNNEIQYIQDTYNDMLAMLAKGDEVKVPLKYGVSKSIDSLFMLKYAYTFSESVEGSFRDIWSDICIGTDDSTVINFSKNKLKDIIPYDSCKTPFRRQKAAGVDIPIGRSVIKIAFPEEEPIYIYIGEEVFLPIVACVGRWRNKYISGAYNKIAFLLYEREPGKIYYIVSEELCVLSVTGKDGDSVTGSFTLLKKSSSKNDILLINPFVKGSPDLSNIDLSDLYRVDMN